MRTRIFVIAPQPAVKSKRTTIEMIRALLNGSVVFENAPVIL